MTGWMPDTCDCAFGIGVDAEGRAVFKSEISRCKVHHETKMLPEHLFWMLWEAQNKLAAERQVADGA